MDQPSLNWSLTPLPPLLRVNLFGRMRAEDAAGRSVLPRVRKTRALLALMALAAPRPVLREQPVALLWSRREPQQARASLRQALADLRAALAPLAAGLLEIDRHALTLRADGLWVDATVLTQATPARPDPLDLFQDGLMEDLAGLDPAFDRWRADESRRLALHARRLAAQALAIEQTPDGIAAAAERLLRIDRADQSAWQALIRAHHAAGDRTAAIAAIHACQEALARAQRAPQPETEALCAATGEGAVAVYGAPPVASKPPDRTGPFLLRQALDRRIRLGLAAFRARPAGKGESLAVGLTEEVAAALASFRGIACIPLNTFLADGSLADVSNSLWQQLDLDFVLHGLVQCADGRLRVIARATEIRGSGEVVWSARFDRACTDVLALQDEIVAGIVAPLEARLALFGGEAGSDRTGSLGVRPLLRQAIKGLVRLDRAEFEAARQQLEQCLRLDPIYPGLHTWLALWHLFAVGQGWADHPADAARRVMQAADDALALDPEDSRALALAAHVRSFVEKRPDRAVPLHERALQGNPHSPLAWCLSGLTRSYLGEHAEATQQISMACQLSPYDPLGFFFEMARGMPLLLSGDYAAAAAAGRRSIALNPGFSSARKGYLAALGHLGETDEAEETRAALLTLEPRFSLSQARERVPIRAADDQAQYVDGLRLGGLG